MVEMIKFVKELPEIRRVIRKLQDVLAEDTTKLALAKRALNISSIALPEKTYEIVSIRGAKVSPIDRSGEDEPEDDEETQPVVRKTKTAKPASKPTTKNQRDRAAKLIEETRNAKKLPAKKDVQKSTDINVRGPVNKNITPKSNSSKINVRGPGDKVALEKVVPLDPTKIKHIQKISDLVGDRHEKLQLAQQVQQTLHHSFGNSEGTAARMIRDANSLVKDSSNLFEESKSALNSLAAKHMPIYFKDFSTTVFKNMEEKTEGNYKSFKLDFSVARGTFSNVPSTYFIAYMIFDEIMGQESTTDYYIVLKQVVPDMDVVPPNLKRTILSIKKKNEKDKQVRSIDITPSGIKIILQSVIHSEEEAKTIAKQYYDKFAAIVMKSNDNIDDASQVMKMIGPVKVVVGRGGNANLMGKGGGKNKFATPASTAFAINYQFMQSSSHTYVQTFNSYKSPPEIAAGPIGIEVTTPERAIALIQHNMTLDRLLNNADPATVPFRTKDLVFKNPNVTGAKIINSDGTLRIYLKPAVKTVGDAKSISMDLFREVKTIIKAFHPRFRNSVRMLTPQKYKIPSKEEGRGKITEQYAIDFTFQRPDGVEYADLPANKAADLVKTLDIQNPEGARAFTRALKTFLGQMTLQSKPSDSK
jgi:hypothetical protein